MARRLLMGLDVGGGSGRALVVDANSGTVSSARSPWSYPRAEHSGPLGFDADIDAIFTHLCDASHRALADADATSGDVVGIAVTSMRYGLAIFDAAGAALYAGPNRDARAVGEGLRLAAEHGEALHAATGHFPMPIMAAPRLQWLRANDSDAWSRAHAVLALNDAVTYRLCGQFSTDPSQAGETLLFDLADRSWAWDWIDRLDFPRALFPAPSEPGSRIGELSSDAADALGLRAGIPVAVGGADTQCGLLGVAALEAGDAAVIAGTTAPVEIVLDRPVADPDARCWQGHHLVRDRWVIESSAGPTGEALDWFAELVHGDVSDPVGALLADAADSSPGAGGLLSTYGTQLMNARAPALPIGQLFISHLLAAAGAERRAHVARSVVEGIAFGMRVNLEQAAGIAGVRVDRLRLGGGMSRSATFSQLLANVTGLPVEAGGTSEATALGAALCAGVASGVFSDLREGASRLANSLRVFEPEANAADRYTEVYEGWNQLREASAPAEELARGLSMRAMMPPAATATSKVPSARPRILVTAALDATSLAQLGELGDVEYASYREAKRMLQGEPLVEALQGFEIFITEIDVVDADSVRSLPELRVVASCRGNAVNVDVEACSLLGIPVLNAPGRNADAVADLALAFMLMLARRFPAAAALLRDTPHEPGEMRILGRAFGELRGQELWRKTVGLIGLGAVGRGVARRARSFGASVIAFDPYVDAERSARDGVEAVSFDELLERSDFVSLHAPVSDKTRGLLGAKQFAQMRAGSFVINTARAVLLDESALADALLSGHLAGAGLDVFVDEPPGSKNRLLAFSNVIATPHIGGNTGEVAAHQGQIITEDLARLLRDGSPRFALNPEVALSLDLTTPRSAPDAAVLARLAELAEGPGPSSSDLNRTKR